MLGSYRGIAVVGARSSRKPLRFTMKYNDYGGRFRHDIRICIERRSCYWEGARNLACSMMSNILT